MGETEVPVGGVGNESMPGSVGERLRAARIAAEMDLSDVAAKTRVPMRHLEAIERSDYDALPSGTYAMGFARSYARAVGADEAALGRDLRLELGRAPPETPDAPSYQPADPARVPSRMLAYTTAVLGVLLVGGYVYISNQRYEPPPFAVDPPPVDASTPTATAPAAAPVATPAPAAAGPVVLTATAPVWLRVYDRADKVLLQGELAKGETFTVPPDADTPMVRTGRADSIRVTVGGREVAPLGPPEKTIRDVVLTASALDARRTPATSPVVARDSAL